MIATTTVVAPTEAKNMTNSRFKEYFEDANGVDIRIDVRERQLSILDAEGNIVRTVAIAKSALQQVFSFDDLMKVNHRVGEFTYTVLMNGFENRDWLYAMKIVAVL
jgi:hypothetical protein